jgi:hypothetical protein
VKGQEQIVHLVCAILKDETALLRPCTSEASIHYPGIYLHSSIQDRWFLRDSRCVRPHRFLTAPEIVRAINVDQLGKISHHKRFQNRPHEQFHAFPSYPISIAAIPHTSQLESLRMLKGA